MSKTAFIERVERDPYRIFFPIGLFFAFWGATVWIQFSFLGSERYPGQQHADIMLGGFSLNFVIGFLMTAVPRFTGTGFAGFKEVISALSVVILLLLAAAFESRPYFLACVVASLLLLLRFAALRFMRRKNNPPFTFVFVGIGILLGLCGFGLMAVQEFGMELSEPLSQMGRNLAFQAMLLSLIVGVGGRLIPGILGRAESPEIQHSPSEQQSRSFMVPSSVLISGLAFVASFPLETFALPMFGRLLRVLVVVWVAVCYWQIFKFPRKRTPYSWIVWVSAWLVVCGVIANASSSGEWAIAGLHLAFIGGFALLILMVASRVILAHGADGLLLEQRKLPYLVSGGLITLAAFTRWLAAITPETYIGHLGYAAGSFMVGLLVWSVYFLPRLKE